MKSYIYHFSVIFVSLMLIMHNPALAKSAPEIAREWLAIDAAAIIVPSVTLAGHTDAVESAAFSPDGTKVVTASLDSTAKIWDVTTGALLYTLAGHTNALYSAAFSPDSTTVVTASRDRTAIA